MNLEWPSPFIPAPVSTVRFSFCQDSLPKCGQILSHENSIDNKMCPEELVRVSGLEAPLLVKKLKKSLPRGFLPEIIDSLVVEIKNETYEILLNFPWNNHTVRAIELVHNGKEKIAEQAELFLADKGYLLCESHDEIDRYFLFPETEKFPRRENLDLFAEYHHFGISERDKEIRDSLLRNLELPFVNKLHLVGEIPFPKDFINHPKVIIHQVRERSTFYSLFCLADKESISRCKVLINSDIILDKDFFRLPYLLGQDEFFALHRTETNGRVNSWGYDAWAWSGNCKLQEAHFELGRVHCDLRINHMALQAYQEKFYCPSLTFTTHHNHASAIRSGTSNFQTRDQFAVEGPRLNCRIARHPIQLIVNATNPPQPGHTSAEDPLQQPTRTHGNEGNMKAFVYCTPTHLTLLNNFLKPSLPTDLDLTVIHGSQDCPTGSFMKEGWLKCMEAKVQMLIDAIRAYPDEILLHLDVDIQFFTPSIAPLIERYLERVDLVAQNNNSLEKTEALCGGLFAFRANERTLGLFHEVLNLMKKTGVHDQDGLNQAILTSGVRYDFFHPDHFWCPRTPWDPDSPLQIPSSTIVHHANWCRGVEHKEAQLRIARQSYEQRMGREFHGSDYGGKWLVENSLTENSVVYSFGVGEDVSFDLSVIDRYGSQVFAFDPTPKAITYGSDFADVEPRFHFFPVALCSGEEGPIMFHLPQDPDHVSCSESEISDSSFQVPAKPLTQIMDELGHLKIDVLKMDIEGSEYVVLEEIFIKLPVSSWPDQILVEFHDHLDSSFPARKENILRNIFEKGYALIFQEGADYSFKKS